MQAYRRTRSVSEPALRLQCSSVSRERRRASNVGYERGRDRAALWISRWSPDEVRCNYPRGLPSTHLLTAGVPSAAGVRSTVPAGVQVQPGSAGCPPHCKHLSPPTPRPIPPPPQQLSLQAACCPLSLQSLESVLHRDLQLSAVGVASGLELRPVSTPLSREVRVRLRKSRRPQVLPALCIYDRQVVHVCLHSIPQNRYLHRAQSAIIHHEVHTCAGITIPLHSALITLCPSPSAVSTESLSPALITPH